MLCYDILYCIMSYCRIIQLFIVYFYLGMLLCFVVYNGMLYGVVSDIMSHRLILQYGKYVMLCLACIILYFGVTSFYIISYSAE